MSDPIILCVGSVNIDLQVRVERRPEPSETLLGSCFLRAGGGKGANRAFMARRLGAPAALVARLGQDELADPALAPLREAGVDLSATRRLAGRATGVSMIAVPPDGQKGIVLAANANRDWEEGGEDAVRRAVEGVPGGSVLALDCEVPDAVALACARAARDRGLPVLLDPSPADRAGSRLLAEATVAVANSGEAETITGVVVDGADAALAAARRLREAGVRAPVVKLPKGGCVVLDGAEAWHVPAVPVEVVDTNGAGDAFAGALAVALLEGRPLREGVPFAAAASHLAVTGWGAQASYPERGAVERLAAVLSERACSLGAARR